MNRILIHFICFSITLTACGQKKNDTMLEQSNCRIEKGEMKNLVKGFKNYLADTNFKEKQMQLQFFNNPYTIDSSFNLVVILYGGIVYEGEFKRNIKLRLPIEINNKACEMKFILERKNVLYIFNTMQVGVVDIVDDFIQIVFMPKENDWFTFYFSFSKNGKYQESP